MEHGMKCTNPECSTDYIVEDCIECPDCGDNKVRVFPIAPKQTSQNRSMNFAVCLHSLRRGMIISTHYVDHPSQIVDILEQCSSDSDIHADISWVANVAEYIKICNTVAGIDMDERKNSKPN
tara:strand:- start:99 stop:464 length:366 start_codon:yes stop_codon:yes gene_type:complete